MGEQPISARSAPGSASDVSQARPSAAVARAMRRSGDQRPDFYTVRSGDTLFGIALDYGFDYRELSAWNDLDDPSRIYPGQRLRLVPPAASPEGSAVVKPRTATPLPSAVPIDKRAEPAASVPVFTEPQAVTLPYSAAAVARLATPSVQTPPPSARSKPAVATAPAGAPARSDTAASDDDAVRWIWPARGPLLYRFGDSGRLKGIGIGGKIGDPVVAAAAGKVVYSGSGLRGYGRLVILKHNETYFSVYAHNSRLLVKEGDFVKQGQEIAEMGDSDAQLVGLHFELRKFGKPVDPLERLPAL
ncbi:MAG: peptidoglycan DD-metalloendopeptidase family protein [Betaproteobacteria bacterium]|nr:peptidoglycan DD-metalloendopeptidase family protein [Betaproteobacteria bacterium]